MEGKACYLKVRPSCLADAPLLYCWRNCPDLMDDIGSVQVSWDEHMSWLTSDRLLSYIATCDGMPVGYVHYYRQDAVYLSIYVMPMFRRHGRAMKMIFQTIGDALEEFGKPIVAHTRNRAACLLFEQTGFRLDHRTSEGILYVYDHGTASSLLQPVDRRARGISGWWRSWFRGKSRA